MLDEREKALRTGSAFSEMSSAGRCFDTSEIKPPRQNTQIKFQEPAAELDALQRAEAAP
jgi:hypothetical protein